MEYDEAFDFVGHLGLYQIFLVFLLGILGIFQGYQNTAMNFLGPKMPHWCQVKRLENFTFAQQKYISIPMGKSEETGEMVYSQCKRFDYVFTNITDRELYQWNRSLAKLNNTVSCQSWVYDRSVFSSAATNEYNLVCGRSLFIQLGSTVYLAGFFVGAITSGALSDKIGRKKAILIFSGVHLVCGTLCAFMPNFAAFAVLRFFTGLGVTSAFTCGFVLLMESIGPRFRMHLLIVYSMWFAVGIGVLSGISYAVRDFRRLQLILAIPAVTVLFFYWTVYESPCWLLFNGRHDEAVRTLHKIACINSTAEEFPNKLQLSAHTKSKDQKRATLFDIFKTPNMRKRTLILYFNWFTESLLFYGLSLNVGNLVGNLHLNAFLNGMVQIPANIVSLFLLDSIGRRWTISGAVVFSGIMMLASIPTFYSKNLAGLRTALNLLGKAGISLSFASVYIWTAELYPTVVRNVGLGSSSTISRISAMVAAYLGGPLGRVWAPLPSLLFGVVAVSAGMLSMLLPETANKTLPESIEEAEQFGTIRKPKIQRRDGQFNTAYDNVGDDYKVGVYKTSESL